MSCSKSEWWERFEKYYAEFSEAGLAVELSRRNVSDEFLASMELHVKKHSATSQLWKKEQQPIQTQADN